MDIHDAITLAQPALLLLNTLLMLYAAHTARQTGVKVDKVKAQTDGMTASLVKMASETAMAKGVMLGVKAAVGNVEETIKNGDLHK
jgi:hypothetical protein